MIRVIDDYVILAGDLDYRAAIDLHKIDGKGCAMYKTVGYYSTIRKCVRGIAKDKARKEFSEFDGTLDEAIDKIDSIEKQFEEIINSIPSVEDIV